MPLGHGDDAAFAVFENDEFAIDLLTRVLTDHICGIYWVELDLPAFDERASKDDIEVRLFRQVDRMGCPGAADSDGPFAQTITQVYQTTQS